MACTIHPDDIKRVKGQGFLNNKGTDKFNARIITTNGKITAQQAQIIAQTAQRYGNGEVTFTSRMTVELPGIPYDKIPEFQEYLAQVGLTTGGTGPKVRPVVSCKGTTCQYGQYDTFALSEKIHQRFYLGYRSVTLPHKFKITTGGCPNNCVKPDLNDLGIIGQRILEVNLDQCKGCGKCKIAQECPMKAASVVDGKVVVDTTLCNHCGRCAGKCPFGVFGAGQTAWKICIGGHWGKQVGQGTALTKLFTSEEEVLDVVEKAILFYKENGLPGERFASTIQRLGFDQVNAALLSDDILARKEQILAR